MTLLQQRSDRMVDQLFARGVRSEAKLPEHFDDREIQGLPATYPCGI